ncbi:MAG: cupredoxin domain-containing protein [Chloroflexi bacterium]|nr:cupredoxin domain-containing protein [Chloroflexota bacterium]
MFRTAPRPAGALAVMLLLAACGGEPAATPPGPAGDAPSPTVDHADMTDMPDMPDMDYRVPADASPTDSPSVDPTEAGDTAVEVMLTTSSFSPGVLTVAAGTEVTFVNDSGLPHTVTHGTNGRAVEDPAFDRPVGDGGSVTITFDEPGTFEITCKLHPTMQMTLTVEG